MWAEYHAELEKYFIPKDDPQRIMQTSAEFDRSRGIVTEYQ
jgi:hypothetical protein